MTALHRLVDAFGGHLVTRIPDADTPFLLCVRVEEEGVGHHILMVPAEMLSPVAPPEPPNHAFVHIVGASGVGATAAQRVGRDGGRADRWFLIGSERARTWAEICELGTVTSLRQDPAASAPALPWRVDAVDGVSVLADRHGVDDPWARNGDAYIQLVTPGRSAISRAFTPAEARALAAVLLAAADDQEAGQQ